MVFMRYCRKCEKLFLPETKKSRVCKECKIKNKERMLKTKRSYTIPAYALLRNVRVESPSLLDI